MRISTKVSLSLALLSLAVFGGLGAVQVGIEQRDLEQALVREASTLCRATAESVRQDQLEQDPADSNTLLESLEVFEQDLDVTVWRPDGPTSAPPLETRLPAELLEEIGHAALSRGELVSRIAELTEDGRVVVVAAPIDPHQTLAAIVLVRPLDTIDADVSREAQTVGLSVLAFSLLGGLLGYVLGEVYIRRPLARLDRAMTVAAAGDLEAWLPQGRPDEVGRVLERFDHMRRELQRARTRLHAEQDAHRTTLERLADANRMVAIGQLAAGLAHEIGSPLQTLHGRAQKLVDGLGPDHELGRHAQIIVAQTERITRVVRQLLQLARPHTHELRPAEPVACVREVVDLLELEARRREAILRLDATPAGLVDINPDAIQQIVFNLVRNSLAALSPGGTVEIRVRVESAMDQGPRRLLIVVADDGRGMSDEVRERAFEPFFTTRSHAGGLGLGLAVVRSLVESMRGTVVAEARPGGGTEITVRMPC